MGFQVPNSHCPCGGGSFFDEEKMDDFYAELYEKTYIPTTDGSLYEPERKRLPKKVRFTCKAL